jgi:glycosyltransferase involved in cell wall biosynthesis
LPEAVGDAALLADPRDPRALAAALRAVLTDSALAAQLRERGLRRAAQFSWANTARNTVAVYEQACAAP